MDGKGRASDKATVVLPGVIDTNIAANSRVGIKVGSDNRQQAIQPLAPSKAAQLIIAGIEQERYRIMPGPDSVLMDLLYRASASFASRFIARLMHSLLPD